MGEEKPMFDDDDKPKAKPKVRDIYAERAKKAEEQEKIVITPAVLPEKEAEAEVEDPLKPKAKVRDEFAEREKTKPEEEKIIIKPAVLPEKAKEEPDDDEEEE